MALYENIQWLVDNRGITIHQLEKDLELSNGSARRWKYNQPNLSTVIKLAKYFNLTVDELLTMEADTKFMIDWKAVSSKSVVISAKTEGEALRKWYKWAKDSDKVTQHETVMDRSIHVVDLSADSSSAQGHNVTDIENDDPDSSSKGTSLDYHH